MSRLPAFSLLFVLAACGGTGLPDLSGEDSCTITVSGAVTGTSTENCVPAATLSQGVAAFALTPPVTTFGTVSFAAEFKTASFATGSYDSTALSQSETTLTSVGGTAAWAQSAGGDGSAVGSATLVISSTGTQINGNGASDWIGSHGTIDATLPAAQGSSSTGTVTVHISF